MFRVAIIDDGVSSSYAKRYSNIKTFFLEVKNNTVLQIKDKKIWRNFNHATMCFLLYANTVKHEMFELISIRVIDKKNITGEIEQLNTALRWCERNSIDLISLSLGTTHYKDFENLDIVIKDLLAKGIITVAAFSNNNKMTYPAASMHSIGVRVDSTNTLSHGEYIVCDNEICGHEIIISGDFTSVVPKKFIDVTKGFNSYATPLIAAKVHLGILQGNHGMKEVINYLRQESCDTNFNLWDLRRDSVSKNEVTIPILYLDSNNVSFRELEYLIDLFELEDYLVFGLYDNESIGSKHNFKCISIKTLLKNCDNDYYNVIKYTQHYTDANMIILYLNSITEIIPLIEDKTIDIIISVKNQELSKLKCPKIICKDLLDIDYVKGQIINMLTIS